MTEPENQEPLAGTFWQVDTPDQAVPGQLSLGAKRGPTLETVGPLFVERAIHVEFYPSGNVKSFGVRSDPNGRVADWDERNIHGVLDDGTPVSMVGAQGRKKRSGPATDFIQYRQEFHTNRHVILGEHVDDRTTYHSCRFRVTGPIWYTQTHGEASTSEGGRLTVTHEGDFGSFEFVPAEAMTMRDFNRRVLSPIETLASLITSNPSGNTDLDVRLGAATPWRQVHSRDESVPRGTHELLNSTHLTAERCARWIDFRRRSDALDAAAIDSSRGATIQTEVLTLAAVAEGLHRRLFAKKRKRVPGLSRRDLAYVRDAAREAALNRLRELDRTDRQPVTPADLTEFTKAMDEGLTHINDVTFKTRVADARRQCRGRDTEHCQ